MCSSGRESITTTCTICSSLPVSTCRNIRCPSVIALDATSKTRAALSVASMRGGRCPPPRIFFAGRESALAIFDERLQARQFAVDPAAAPHQHEDISEHDDPCRRITEKEGE